MGIITGYSARTDPAQFGYGLSVLIEARLLPGEMNNVIKAVRQTSQIVACDRVSVEDCFVARADARDVAEMEVLIDRIVSVGATNSSIAQSSPMKARPIDLVPYSGRAW